MCYSCSWIYSLNLRLLLSVVCWYISLHSLVPCDLSYWNKLEQVYSYKFELENSTVNAKGTQNQSTQKLSASYHSSSFHHKVAAVNQLCTCQPTNQNCVPASQSEVCIPASLCSSQPIRSVYLSANHQCVCQPACVSSSQPTVFVCQPITSQLCWT